MDNANAWLRNGEIPKPLGLCAETESFVGEPEPEPGQDC
jgi:hypothetical protein